MKKFHSGSAEDTRRIGREFGASAKPGEVYTLSGDLGAGKTEFAKGFAEGLGVTEPVTSPTFIIVNEYQGRIPLFHFDIYRLEDSEELFEIGFEEYLYKGGVCLIEWAERAYDMLPEEYTDVHINYTDVQGERLIEVYYISQR